MKKIQHPVMITKRSIVANLRGLNVVIMSTATAYRKVLKAYREDDLVAFERHIDAHLSVESMGTGRFKIKDNDIVTFTHSKGHVVEVPEGIAKQVVFFAQENLPYTAIEMFCDKLFENDSFGVVNRLFSFLEANDFAILPDGNFLGYKKVGPDYGSLYRGYGATVFDNSPGKVVQVERNKVDDDHRVTCSYGLHVSAFEYAHNFKKNSSNKLVEVSVDPRDVVAVPPDYNNQKIRCCKYTVLRDASDRIKPVEEAYYEPDEYDAEIEEMDTLQKSLSQE